MSEHPINPTISFGEAEDLSLVAWEVDIERYEQMAAEALETIRSARGDEDTFDDVYVLAVAKLEAATKGFESLVRGLGVNVQQENN